MPTGPQKIILIQSGRYEYAEVEVNGALQIVGPNNTGKTTLINTLQFLYLDDRRHMDFGSYTPEQTRDFYFPNQYSYVLFQCLGMEGACVLGWRGQSKASAGDPERFFHSGPYDESDFLDGRRQVREPREVNARLAVKGFRVLRTAQEHRELLLVPVGEKSRGLGIVALRDGDKYHQFRETLKCLLTLSAITQEQMRDRLLMLAEIPPDRTALDVRALFGEDYDRICQRRERLVRFKKNQSLVERLVEKCAAREVARGELIYRWTDLRSKRQAFEHAHEATLESHRLEARRQAEALLVVTAELSDRRGEVAAFSKEEGSLATRLGDLAKLDAEFADYVEPFERIALSNLQKEIHALENQLANAERESRDKAKQKIEGCTGLVAQAEQTIAHFDNLAVTALRKHFSDEELNTIFRVLNRGLLEIPMGPDGVEVKRQQDLITAVRAVLSRVVDGVYHDANVSIKLSSHSLPLAGLESVETAREQLREHRETLARWQGILAAIEQREKLRAEWKKKGEDLENGERRRFRFEAYQTAKAGEPRLRAELKNTLDAIAAANERIKLLEGQAKTTERAEANAKGAILKEENEFNVVLNRFGDCIFPEYAAAPRAAEDIPNDFDAAIALFLRQQETQAKLADETAQLLGEVERYFGDEFRGADEQETIGLLGEELEALPDKEEALVRDWNAHIHGLKATFDRVLKELSEVQSAKDGLNRQFAKVKVSNLRSLKMEVNEQADLVTWIRRLAAFEPGGLFDRDPERESALVNFRTKLQANPIVRFTDLFTLGVTVEGPDGRKHHYHDLRQIESHGTTVAIKVLFNLLLLKSQLKRDDCQVPFFLDEVQILDPANRHAILATAGKLGFLAITAAPEAVSEVDALYFLQPNRGRIVLRNKHRVGVQDPAPSGMTLQEGILAQIVRLSQLGAMPRSACSASLLRRLEPLLHAGVLVVERSGGGKRLVVRDPAAFAAFRRRHFPEAVAAGASSRTVGVARFRDSKVFASDTPEIVSVRAWADHALLKDGQPTEVVAATARNAVFSFLLGEGGRYALRGACALVENPAVFAQFERLRLPVGLVIYGHGRVSQRLLQWLARMQTPDFHLVHLPDYDPVGVTEFERLRHCLGQRVSLYVPEELEQRFLHFSKSALLQNAHARAILAKLRRSPTPEVRRVVALMDRHNAGLEQEALLLPAVNKSVSKSQETSSCIFGPDHGI